MKNLTFLLVIFSFLNSLGQTFTNYTTADGLVDNNVLCATSQGNGVMWFGTQNGISKFDGFNWTNITTITDTALISNTITAIKTMSNGDLWVGTDFGVCKYSNSTWTSYTTTDGLGDNRVKYITESSDGRIWIGEYDGLSIFDGVNFTTYNMSDGIPFGGIQHISFDNNQDAWLGSGFGGLIKFDGNDFTVYNSNDGLLNNIVNSIAIDNQNKKWVGTSSGLSVFNNQNILHNNYTQMYLLPPPDTLNPVMGLGFDSRNLLWVGIYIDYLLDGGVAMYNGYSWVDFNASDGLIGPVITDLIIDDQDQVWITTSSGISKITDVPAITNDIIKDDIIIYPNPSNGEFNFHSSIKKYHLKIFNAQGKIVYNNRINNSSKIEINPNQISKGIYIAKVENLTNHLITTKKILIK
jgi:ligand-binding sensor domain-containing protein